MKVIDCIQNTPEWFSARCGVPSASNFDKIIQTNGDPSKQRTKYLWQLAGEILCGKQEESYQNAEMVRGSAMQEEAKNLFELIKEVNVQEVGFCLHDVGAGASPDGLIGDDSGIEIKCPSMATHIGYLIDNKLPTEYFQQVQGNLFVTGRKTWNFMSYYPGIRPLIIRVERYSRFIMSLEAELSRFVLELNDLVKKLK